MEQRIAFIGGGNLATSLIGGLIANGHPPQLLHGADPDAGQREQAAELFGIPVTADNGEAVQGAGVVVLAVKPRAVHGTLAGVSGELAKQQPLVLSIAAGIRQSTLREAAGGDLPVVRVMPNTPSLIQAGAAALHANAFVSGEQRELAEAIMRSVGITVWLEAESGMDTVTALSGSGPAYFFLVMEAMETAAMHLGLDAEQARLLTLETAFGASKMAMESGHDPAVLRRQVTSPGGTTEKAIDVLLQGDIMELFQQALRAAQQRAEELGAEFDRN